MDGWTDGVLGTAEWIHGETGTTMGSWRSGRGKAGGYMVNEVGFGLQLNENSIEESI